MKLTNKNVLIASLLGAKTVEALPRFTAVENEMTKRVMPSVPFLPVQIEERIKTEEAWDPQEVWMNDRNLSDTEQFFPFSFKRENEDQFYLLPWEPMISISARNIIAKRHVAKAGSKLIGTIKERISTDDFEITITGAFYGEKMRGAYPETYPREDMERLRDYFLIPERLQVKSEPLQILGINYISIEEVNFPFTKGENVQAYEIKAVSDFDWDLVFKKTRGKSGFSTGDIEIIDFYE